MPRDPKKDKHDQPHLEEAGERHVEPATSDWCAGRRRVPCGTGFSYDPELGLVYVGTANPAHLCGRQGRPPSGGDQLYAASILAIKAASGELAWHYQEVPGDGWDYDATQKMVLTELEVDGHPRKVLMQAAKDGFFYVLDRATAQFLSGARSHSSTGPRTRSGDPPAAPHPAADYSREPKLVYPAKLGRTAGSRCRGARPAGSPTSR